MKVLRYGRWLAAAFQEPHEVLSWAICGGGSGVASAVAWYQVQSEELKPPTNAKQFLRQQLEQTLMLGDAVGMITGADLDGYTDIEKRKVGLEVRTVATVDLGNALRVGDPGQIFSEEKVGTINLLCVISACLTKEAFVESLSIAAEARTAAVLESGIPSIETALPATGTGTDCIVIAASAARDGKELIEYAGKHTLLGSLIGQSVFEAVQAGAARFKQNLKKEEFV